MKNKKGLVLGVALVLLALVAGVVLAGELNGVQWAKIGDSTYIQNDNDYRVTVTIVSDDPPGVMPSPYQRSIAEGGNVTVPGVWTVINVRRGRL
jgi:hypothetical protein